jgi:hypothetical protein
MAGVKGVRTYWVPVMKERAVEGLSTEQARRRSRLYCSKPEKESKSYSNLTKEVINSTRSSVGVHV